MRISRRERDYLAHRSDQIRAHLAAEAQRGPWRPPREPEQLELPGTSPGTIAAEATEVRRRLRPG